MHKGMRGREDVLLLLLGRVDGGRGFALLCLACYGGRVVAQAHGLDVLRGIGRGLANGRER